MRVRKIDTSLTRDVRQFIQFPFDLYANCPQWVPPFVSDMNFTLNRSTHPFYRHSLADFFVAESEGETLGRVAGINHRNFNNYHKSSIAFFYHFDAVDDTDVSRALFDAAAGWAREQGLDTIIGPKGLLRADAMGILVEGFEHWPAIGVPYNYPYYEKLVVDAGFEKEIDHLSGHLQRGYELPQRFFDIAETVRTRRGLSV